VDILFREEALRTADSLITDEEEGKGLQIFFSLMRGTVRLVRERAGVRSKIILCYFIFVTVLWIKIVKNFSGI